jgi:hypothetical protein
LFVRWTINGKDLLLVGSTVIVFTTTRGNITVGAYVFKRNLVTKYISIRLIFQNRNPYSSMYTLPVANDTIFLGAASFKKAHFILYWYFKLINERKSENALLFICTQNPILKFVSFYLFVFKIVI